MENVKPVVKLIGADGNVFNLIGLCTRAARKAGWPAEKVSAVTREMMSQGSYDAVLRFMLETFDVR